MATISVRVPDEIKKTMDSYDDVNWSAVLRKSVNTKLEEMYILQQIKQGQADISSNRVIPHKEVVRKIQDDIRTVMDKKR